MHDQSYSIRKWNDKMDTLLKALEVIIMLACTSQTRRYDKSPHDNVPFIAKKPKVLKSFCTLRIKE